MILMSPKHLEDIKRGSVREYVSNYQKWESVFQINENQKAKCRIIVLCNKHNGQLVCWPVFSSVVWCGC